MLHSTEFLLALILTCAVVFSLYGIYRNHRNGSRKTKNILITQICSFFAVALGVGIFAASGLAAETGGEAAAEAAKGLTDVAFGYLAAALATGLSGIGGGIAVGGAASAALGAISENDKNFGKAILFVGLAEGVALYGLVISFMILGRL